MKTTPPGGGSRSAALHFNAREWRRRRLVRPAPPRPTSSVRRTDDDNVFPRSLARARSRVALRVARVARRQSVVDDGKPIQRWTKRRRVDVDVDVCVDDDDDDGGGGGAKDDVCDDDVRDGVVGGENDEERGEDDDADVDARDQKGGHRRGR